MKKLILLLLSSLSLVSPSYAADGMQQLVIQSGKTKIKFNVEIADDDLEREKGLMFRKALDADKGMLFIFRSETIEGFWMKNTLIPLDMIFIARDGRITKVHKMAKPHDLTVISSDEPVIAVLEIKGGEAEKQGIKEGNKVISPKFVK